MKKFAIAIEAIGLLIAFTAMCFDVTEYAVLAIPILAGFGLLGTGVYIEERWIDEKNENLIKRDSVSDDTDDGITWITYDSGGNERYMDSR